MDVDVGYLGARETTNRSWSRGVDAALHCVVLVQHRPGSVDSFRVPLPDRRRHAVALTILRLGAPLAEELDAIRRIEEVVWSLRTQHSDDDGSVILRFDTSSSTVLVALGPFHRKPPVGAVTFGCRADISLDDPAMRDVDGWIELNDWGVQLVASRTARLAAQQGARETVVGNTKITLVSHRLPKRRRRIYADSGQWIRLFLAVWGILWVYVRLPAQSALPGLTPAVLMIIYGMSAAALTWLWGVTDRQTRPPAPAPYEVEHLDEKRRALDSYALVDIARKHQCVSKQGGFFVLRFDTPKGSARVRIGPVPDGAPSLTFGREGDIIVDDEAVPPIAGWLSFRDGCIWYAPAQASHFLEQRLLPYEPLRVGSTDVLLEYGGAGSKPLGPGDHLAIFLILLFYSIGAFIGVALIVRFAAFFLGAFVEFEETQISAAIVIACAAVFVAVTAAALVRGLWVLKMNRLR